MYKLIVVESELKDKIWAAGLPAQILPRNTFSVYNSLSATIHLYMIRPYKWIY